MSSLYERLKQQREARQAALHGVPEVPQRSASILASPVGLAEPWRECDPEVWEARFFEPHSQVASDLRRLLSAGLLLRAEPDGIRFFDTETTGLSGGAGTLVFLFASSRIVAGGLQTTLLFLSDFSGEPFFLSRVSDELASADTLVSYNGRAFDSALLKNRFLLNRMEPVSRPHLDLLYPARRLFARKLDSCSLGRIESSVLGLSRRSDVPGSEIPDRYFRFLQSRNATELEPVFAHVRQDVVSLALLLGHLERLFAEGIEGRTVDSVDRLGLARILLEQPFLRGASRSESVARAGLEMLSDLAAQVDLNDSYTAAVRATTLLRRAGSLEEAIRLWRLHFERRRSVWAAVELAKCYEHRLRRFDQALAFASEARRWPHAGALADDLDRRIARLERRLRRNAERQDKT